MSVDQITKPGAIVSGKVTFSDGQIADWYLDQSAFWPSLKVTLPLTIAPGRVIWSTLTETFPPEAGSAPSGTGIFSAVSLAGVVAGGSTIFGGSGSFNFSFKSSTRKRTSM